MRTPDTLQPPELGKDCYYLVLDSARKDLLLPRAKPGDRIFTLREFCERGLALYSDRPVISRDKELALLASVISKHGRIYNRGALIEIYRLMDELSKNFKEIKPENERLEELGNLISLHYSYLGNIISRTMIEREALSLMEKNIWFPIRKVYLETYPIVSEVEGRIAKALDSMGDLTLISSNNTNFPDHYFAFVDANEEIEFVAREIIKANISGVPLEFMAVITPKVDYLQIIEEIFNEYSIPHTNYAYNMVKDTEIFEFLSQLVALKKNNFRTLDVIELFSSPLVRFRSVNKSSMKKIKNLLKGEGIEGIEKNLRTGEKEVADDLIDALRMIDDPDSSPISMMLELGVVQSIISTDAGRESIAYKKVVDAIRDLVWAGEVVGEKQSIEALVDLLYNKGYPAQYAGGVSILLDKSGFWGGFERSFYCGLGMSALYPEGSKIMDDEEARALGVLERKKSIEMRERIVRANMRGTITCVVNDSDFTIFDALGLSVERRGEERNEIFSKADFERALAKSPELIEHAEKLGKDYLKKIESARPCIESREYYETNEYNGILNREVALKEISPVALEDYVRCPFYCFAKHILRLRESIEDRKEIAWGNAVHRAMKALYSNEDGIEDSRLKQEFFEKGMERIRSVMLEYMDDPYLGIKVKRALNNSFPEVLKIEQSIEDKPVHLEQMLSKDLCGVTLKGRVDRAGVADGKIFVYEYKTSMSNEGIELMQLPLYLYMEGQPYGGGYYYLIDDRRAERKDFFEGRAREVVEEVINERAPAIIESIRKGFFPTRFMKGSKNCRECEVRRACYTTRRMVLPFPFGSYVRSMDRDRARGGKK